MRLDPNAMHWPIYSAGRLLAQLGRQEVFNCIDGLNQNGYAYDGTLHVLFLHLPGIYIDSHLFLFPRGSESWKHAEELQALYQTSAVHGAREPEILIHPYLTAEPRATRGMSSPNVRFSALRP